MKQLTLLALLVGLGVTPVSAQLTFYVDSQGKRVYVNAEPKAEASSPKDRSTTIPAKAPARKWLRPRSVTPVSYSVARAATAVPAAAPVVAGIAPKNTAPTLEAVVQETARRHSVDANLVKAMIQTESARNPYAVSNKGAQGLMQLMPFTARELGVRNVFDPVQNVDGGVRYLKYLMSLFDNDLSLSLAAYNAGPGAVERHGGIPPYRETREYVKKISNLYGSLRTQVVAEEHRQPGIVRFMDENGRLVYTNLP